MNERKQEKAITCISVDTSNSTNPSLSSSSFPPKKKSYPSFCLSNITKPGTWESWLSLPLTIPTSNQSPSPVCSSGADSVLNPPSLLPVQTVTLSPELSHQSLLSSLAWTRHQPLSNPSSRKLPKRSFKTAPLSVSHPVIAPLAQRTERSLAVLQGLAPSPSPHWAPPPPGVIYSTPPRKHPASIRAFARTMSSAGNALSSLPCLPSLHLENKYSP